MITREKIYLDAESLFLLALDLFLIAEIMDHTYFPMPSEINNTIELISVVLVIIKILWDFKLKENFISLSSFIILTIFISISILSALNIRNVQPIITAILIMGARKVDFIKILKHFAVVASFCLLITFIAYFLGIANSPVLVRDGVIRYTFGYKWPTDLAELITFILMSELYICMHRKKRLSFRIPIYIIVGLFSYYVINARLASTAIFALIPLSLFYKSKIFQKSKLVKSILVLFMPICVLLSIFLVTLYTRFPKSIFLVNLDNLLSHRLYLEVTGVKLYGYTIFGQNIVDDYIVRFHNSWFYIDSSYYIFLLEYGIALLIFLCMMYIVFVKRCLQIQEHILAIMLSISCIIGLVAQVWYLPEYNIFLLSFFPIIENKLKI